MFPVYGDMNSHYTYQPPYGHCNFPSWEAFRPQMKEDGSNTRPMPEYWPSNYGYPAPMPCQNCCSHGQQPSYYNVRPPCPHFLMPPSYGHYYGGYPAAYPQPYPYVPPPNYSMEMPRYEFDKGSPKAFHCCECPNHPSHVKSTSNVKIEEQDPEVETKKATSLIPAGSSSSPHPLMWAPPGYMMNKEQPRRVVDRGNLDKPQVLSNVEKPKRSIQAIEQDPNVGYQWLPLDMDSIKRLMEGGELMKPQEKKDGDEKKSADVEKNDQNKQFPYPIIWMPYGGQGEDQTRGKEEKNIGKSPAVKVDERNKGKLPVEECPPTFKLLKQPDKELVKEKIGSGDDANGAGTSGSRKSGIVKIIPVKQLDDPVPKSEKKEQEGELNKSVKNVESVKNGTDMKPSSPTKKSKLPPICLRVDPPRKKNGKGSSRSPSPPGEKRHQVSSGSKEEGKDREKIQAAEVAGNAPKGNGVVVPDVSKEEKGSCTREHQSEAEAKVVHTSDSSMLNATVCEDSAVHAQESRVKESEHMVSDAPERKVLSETEAAVILQSAYRGYAVRRWEPLTKLKHIANVKEEARKASERVEKLESCVTVDDKEKVAIGEMIMNLLLKLDTIQGLHPSVRDVRKSVAKELIRLQEKLDSIVSEVSIPTGPCSATITGVEQQPNALGSDEESAGSSEITSDVSKTTALDRKEGEEASVSEVPLSQSLESQVTNKEELGRESHNEDEVPSSGSSSEVSVSCLEKKEREPEEIITSLEDPSMEIQVDVLTDQKPLKGTPRQFTEEDQEGNQDADVLQENVENDILRMEWECDLGAVKIDREESQVAEASKEIEEQLQLVDISCPAEKCDEEVASALEVEKVAEEHGDVIVEDEIEIETSGNCCKEREMDQHQPIQKSLVQGDDFQKFETTDGIKYMEQHVVRDGQVITPVDSEDTPAQAVTGTCNKGRAENLIELPQESLEEVEDDICRMEWECDMGAAKFTAGTDQETTQLAESQGLEKQASEVENLETEDQADRLSGKSQVQSDGFNAVHTENHIIAEPCEEKDTATRESDTTIGILDVDARESEILDGSMEVPIVERGQAVPSPSLEPDMEVEKQMITELPVSEGIKEECTLDSSASQTTAQQYDEQINREETKRMIIEENEKLRSMVEKLLASGKDQQNVISTLTAKINALEKKLPKRRNKLRSGKRPWVVLTRNGS